MTGLANSARLLWPIQLLGGGLKELKKTRDGNGDEKGKTGRPFGGWNLVGVSFYLRFAECRSLKRCCTPASQLINQLGNAIPDEACAASNNKKSNLRARWARGANVPSRCGVCQAA